jgi:ketosteroid isomerase-like protein
MQSDHLPDVAAFCWTFSQEIFMNNKSTMSGIFSLMLLGILLGAPAQADDVADATAASDAFYAALPVLDDGSAMADVFAQTPYVTFVGPMGKDIIVGWPAVQDYFKKANARFASRNSQITKRTLHVNGNVAWEVGIEVGDSQLKDGPKMPVNWVVTNVLEKQADGKWLMVSHHVQPGLK